MKRKKTKGLITAGKMNLTIATSWFRASAQRFANYCKAQGREPETPENGPDWLRIQNRDDGEPEILIYGFITPFPWFDDEVSASMVYQQLQDISGPRIHVRLNSGGGSIFEAIAMMNLLREKNAEIIMHIDGLAASAAGWLAMAGDEIIAGEATRLMIHRATSGLWGDAEEMRKEADLLESLEESILQIFHKRTGKPVDELRELMNAETWLTAEEAVEEGFADRLAVDEEEAEEESEEPGNATPPRTNEGRRTAPETNLESEPGRQDRQGSDPRPPLTLRKQQAEALKIQHQEP